MDIFSGLWLADFIGTFLDSGGKGVYYFHYLPIQMEHGCNDSQGTFGMFTVDENYKIEQRLAQFYVAQLINLDRVQPGSGSHDVFHAKSDVEDGAGHAMVTAYAVARPDGQWSVMLVNRDQETAHKVRIYVRSGRRNVAAIRRRGKRLNLWQGSIPLASIKNSLHGSCGASGRSPVNANGPGHADPDGPAVHAKSTRTRIRCSSFPRHP